MKRLIIGFLGGFMLLVILNSYPQAMLKKCVGIQYTDKANVVDKVYKSKNEYLDVNVIIPQIENLTNENQQKNVNDKIIKWTEAWINDVKEVADDYFKNAPAPLMPYQLYARYKITNNSDILSFYIDYYKFTGGAHGVTTRIAYNVDLYTGAELMVEDLFKKDFDFKRVIDKEIGRQIAKDPDRYFMGKDGFNGIKQNQSFYIKNNSLVIYFGLYEIAPYASGISEFIIPHKLLDGNLIYDRI